MIPKIADIAMQDQGKRREIAFKTGGSAGAVKTSSYIL
jgi:hypothetical protein